MSGRGTLLADRYRLQERVGGGGMGEVWRATDQVLSRNVAVKLMHAALVAEQGFAERFLAEARTMATIRHRGVVGIHDYRGDEQGAFLVMEYVEGEALAQRLQREGPLDPETTMDLVAQAAEALQAAHDREIVHRDIKPGNLLLATDGSLVLTDFGIARSAAAAPLTAAGAMIGTPAYLSPEQVLGEPATARSDLYALGVVAYECLTGRRPFDGDNPFEVAMQRLRQRPQPLTDVPEPVAALVTRALTADPEQRWQTARELAAAAREAASPAAGAGLPPTRQGFVAGRAQLPGPPASPPPPPQSAPQPAPQLGPHQAPHHAPHPASHQARSGHRPVPPPPSAVPPPPGDVHSAGGASPTGAGQQQQPSSGPAQPSPGQSAPARPAQPAQPAPAGPTRPVPLVLAGLLLCLTAGALLVASVATVTVLEEGLAAARSLYGDDFTSWYDTVRISGYVAVGAVALFAAAYLVLGLGTMAGWRSVRGTAFALAVPLFCCCGPAWLLGWLGGTGGWLDHELVAEFASGIVAAVPSWYEPTTQVAMLTALAATLLALLLLVLPATGRYLRRP